MKAPGRAYSYSDCRGLMQCAQENLQAMMDKQLSTCHQREDKL